MSFSDWRHQERTAGIQAAAGEPAGERVLGERDHCDRRVLGDHVHGAVVLGEAQVHHRHEPRAVGAGRGQRVRLVLLVPAVRRVAVPQRDATLGRRQDADGQHRVGRPAGGRRPVDRPPVRAAAAVRVGQHHDRGAQGHTAAGARRGARVETVQG